MDILKVSLSPDKQTAAPVESMHFGKSNGSSRSYRIEFQGFEGEAYRVAVATKEPFFFSSLFFKREIYDLNTKTTKTVWININSFKKRFSHEGIHALDSKSRRFLIKNAPEAIRQNLLQAFGFERDDDESLESIPNMPQLSTIVEPPLRVQIDSKHQAPLSSVTPDSPPIPEERIQRIQAGIRQAQASDGKLHIPFADAQIAEFCRIADQEAAKPRSAETAKIEAKEYHLNRSILIGPAGKFLLLTHRRKEKDRLVGEGAFKQVKFAINLDTGEIKIVAIVKKSMFDKQRWKDATNNLPDELKGMRELSNNADVVHLTFCHHQSTANQNAEERYYVLMDYCDGGDLYDRIQSQSNQSPFSPLNRAEHHQWTLEIARGLTTMHRHEFLHRDLKPENIFLQDNHAKIGDLGFACTIQEAQNRDPSGTPAFAAPECFRGAKSSIKSDSWSLGCLAFEILTGGKALFAFKDPLDALYYFYTDRPSDVQKKINARIELAPPQYRKLLKGLLTLDPAKRMTAEEFYTEFSKLPVPR